MEQSGTESTLENLLQPMTIDNADPTDLTNDSILGKFNSVDELAKAYEQLQSAFTKKSQELAEFKDKVSVTEKKTVKENQQVRVTDNCKCTATVTSIATMPPAVIAGTSGGFAFTNVSEARTMHATTKVAENFFKEKKI